jgi:O-antigen/teichoic acid export membrane protein
MYTYFGVFALIISGFFVVFGQEIAVFLFGEAFRFSGYMLQFAAPCLIFNCWATISLNMLAGLGKIKQRLAVVAVALGVNLLLNLIFLILLGKGLVFSAIILSASWVVMALGALWVIRKEYSFTLDWRFLLRNLLVIVILCVGMEYGKGFLPLSE